jgi:hypothetical protein
MSAIENLTPVDLHRAVDILRKETPKVLVPHEVVGMDGRGRRHSVDNDNE